MKHRFVLLAFAAGLVAACALVGCKKEHGPEPKEEKEPAEAPSIAAPQGGAQHASAHDEPDPTTDPALITTDHATLARLQTKFKRCFNLGLSIDPNVTGKTLFVVNVDAGGKVISTDTSATTGLTPTIVKCLDLAVRGAQFASAPAERRIQFPAALQASK